MAATQWIAIVVNAGVFLAELAAGEIADSRSLQADALDFFGDAANYVISPPAIGSRPVQLGMAVNMKPAMTAPTKPNSISCRCQAKASNAVGIVICPASTHSQSASATTAHSAPPRKKGLNPPLRIGGAAAIRARRRASICSPRVCITVSMTGPLEQSGLGELI